MDHTVSLEDNEQHAQDGPVLTFVKHASPFVPLMFIAQEPQMPSLHTIQLSCKGPC